MDPSSVRTFRADGDEILDGAIIGAAAWYRIEDGILDALPASLAPAERRRDFAVRYDLPVPPPVAGRPADDDLKKAAQVAFFRDDSVRYDREVSERPFYVASDRICFGEWVTSLPPNRLVCDIGAGSGRLTLPLAIDGQTVVSVDISEEMLRLSRRRAIEAGVESRITFLLADAERLPLRDEQFDAATCYGALHHVPTPRAVVREAARVLRPGGSWFSYDPHRSKVRFLFEWTMRLTTLYQELDAGNPLISEADAAAWCRDAGLTSEIKLHFFLPPHLLMMMSPAAAERWLRVTDRAFHAVGLRSLAGIIVVSGTKSQAVPA